MFYPIYVEEDNLWNNKIVELMVALGKPGDHWLIPPGLTWVSRVDGWEFEENNPLEHTQGALVAGECLSAMVWGLLEDMDLVAVWKDDSNERLLALSLVGPQQGTGGKELVAYIPLDY